MDINSTKRNWDLLSKEQRKEAIDKIISYYLDEKDEEIGIVAAEDILDFFLAQIGLDIYKKGISEAKKIINDKLENLNLDLDALTDQ